jgi:hypothetical protein
LTSVFKAQWQKKQEPHFQFLFPAPPLCENPFMSSSAALAAGPASPRGEPRCGNKRASDAQAASVKRIYTPSEAKVHEALDDIRQLSEDTGRSVYLVVCCSDDNDIQYLRIPSRLISQQDLDALHKLHTKPQNESMSDYLSEKERATPLGRLICRTGILPAKANEADLVPLLRAQQYLTATDFIAELDDPLFVIGINSDYTICIDDAVEPSD